MKIQGQGHGQGQIPWPHLGPRIQSMFAFCFMAIRPFLAEIKQIPSLTLKIQGQVHNENWPKSNQVIYRSWSLILPKMKEIWKAAQKLSCEQKLAASGGASGSDSGVQTCTKHKHTPSLLEWLNNWLDLMMYLNISVSNPLSATHVKFSGILI